MEYLKNPFDAYREIPGEAIMTGYTMKTTYWGDFRVCAGDIAAIKDTYKRARMLAEDNAVYGAELAMVLNWLAWGYSETHREVALVYQNLWEEWHDWCLEHYKGEDLNYYLRVTD